MVQPVAVAPNASGTIDRVAGRHHRIDHLAHVLHAIDLESEVDWAAVDRLVDEAESLWDEVRAPTRAQLDEARRAELGYD